MIKVLGLWMIAFIFLAEVQLPHIAVGKWTVGKPYVDVGQPIGLDAKQERAIVGLVIKVSPKQIAVCGRDIPITSVEVDHLTTSDFLAKYNFTPDRIGFSDGPLVEISLNKWHSTKACGEFVDPGTHLLISKGHAVVEVGNDYFRLTK
jgi:hypothetical protein